MSLNWFRIFLKKGYLAVQLVAKEELETNNGFIFSCLQATKCELTLTGNLAATDHNSPRLGKSAKYFSWSVFEIRFRLASRVRYCPFSGGM